ncbi:hypothetical protein [Burkholderia sp. F1]|uniref:hypothetical protein n=1 Tax=Burkholderia sp. F1 TaxID=3366817 RepID=UPI003D71A862
MNREVTTGMPTDAFIKGFRYELANRAFALRAIARVARRLDGDARLPFWEAYLKLEQFNAPRYRAAARTWGLDAAPGWWTRGKAWAVGSVPKLLLTSLLKFVYSQTVPYLEELRNLRRIGPAEAHAFLDYVVDQEAVQVEMMRLALDGRHAEVTHHLDAFLRKQRAFDA